MVFQFSPSFACDPDKVVAVKRDKDKEFSVVIYFDNGLELNVDGCEVEEVCNFIEEVNNIEKRKKEQA